MNTVKSNPDTTTQKKKFTDSKHE